MLSRNNNSNSRLPSRARATRADQCRQLFGPNRKADVVQCRGLIMQEGERHVVEA